MNVHKNARLTPSGRVLLVERIEAGWSVVGAAAAAGVSARTAHRWLGSGDGAFQRGLILRRLGLNRLDRLEPVRR